MPDQPSEDVPEQPAKPLYHIELAKPDDPMYTDNSTRIFLSNSPDADKPTKKAVGPPPDPKDIPLPD